MPPSKLWTRPAHDRGSASLEFLTVGLLLLLPTVYLVLALSAAQGAFLAADGAARQAARVYVQSESAASADEAVADAVEVALADYGIDPGSADIRIDCAPNPAVCLTRRATVTVTVGVTVALPLIPPAVGADVPASIPVQASATEQVSRFWGSR
ncbi:MAG TPA: hypothetical protein VNT53_01430 [Pseudolysinimonas sp.]|nr:hypothetical protein [Pseudolysinimonas sp.]